jgi:hypothetical protein
VLQADSPDEWLAAISLLFENPDQRERLAGAAQMFVRQHHTWSARLSPLVDLLGLGDQAEASLPAIDEAEALAVSPLSLGEG